MKKFAFSLQQVLNAREAERSAVEMRLGAILCELEKEKAARNVTNRKISEQVHEIENLGCGSSSRQKYMLHIRYLEGLQQQLLVHAANINEIEQRADGVRRELHKAVRACKSLEKLKEHEQTEWSADLRREEQGHIDNIAVSGFFRQQAEGIL